MNILLLGATGKTGYAILQRLSQEGHAVKAIVRNPQKVDLAKLEHPDKVELVKGDIYNLDILKKEVRNCDVVISALGTGKSNNYTEIYSEGGRNILAAMRESGVKRLLTITSGIIDMSDPATDNFFLNRIIRPNFNKVYYDQTRWETILDDTTDINWTCFRPTNLTDKGFTGQYRVQDRHCPKGGWKISRADLAHFMVDQIQSPEFICKKPVIAY